MTVHKSDEERYLQKTHKFTGIGLHYVSNCPNEQKFASMKHR